MKYYEAPLLRMSLLHNYMVYLFIHYSDMILKSSDTDTHIKSTVELSKVEYLNLEYQQQSKVSLIM